MHQGKAQNINLYAIRQKGMIFIMNKFENTIIIGIDHGFGNIKTATHIFPSGVKCYDDYPAIDTNLLI